MPRPSQSTPPAVPAPGRYVFPISPPAAAHFGHSHHDYPATDIFAPCGSTYRAPTSGRVLGAQRVDAWNPIVNAGATRGGLSVTLLGDDGVRYYGSHLRSVLPAVVTGARVAAGQVLGQVGNTGDARGTACHVHFGISPLCGGYADWYNRRGLVYPWPFLDSWRAGGALSPAAAVAAYRARHGCPTGPTVDS
ncbi:MAG: M23 family metallopeptidase [Pseudonocardiales bacterium]